MTPEREQTSLPLSDGDDHASEVTWLGLVISHRRLLNALQDGWLRPLESDSGLIIGVEAYARERDMESGSYPILAHIKLDKKRLPTLDLHIFRGEGWESDNLNTLEAHDRKLYWPGPIPTFAIFEVMVSTEEERIRLISMARSASNVVLPEKVITIVVDPEEYLKPDAPPSEVNTKLIIPENEDAIRGAMSMAVWGVPRIDPWLDLLTSSLISKGTPELHNAADKVEAAWWRFPPWAPQLNDVQPINLHESLWLAAINVFQEQSTEGFVNSRELAERVASAAARCDCSENSNAISTWLKATHSILRAESTIQLTDWRSCPVGIAIQLVLTRPEPTNFKTWFKDFSNLPPVVAWSGATLCGLLHGYKRLDIQFRGNALQRELLSIHALHISECALQNSWPSYTTDGLRWRSESNEFILSWNGVEFFRKPRSNRGRWYAADFEEEGVEKRAREEANRLEWPCVDQYLDINDDVELPISGPGTMKARAKPHRKLEVRGKVSIQMPKNYSIRDSLNVELFRHFIAVEEGILSKPEMQKIYASDKIEQTEVPGLTYKSDFLSEDEERNLVEIIDKNPWLNDLERRVQHYGWRYDYSARKVDLSMRLGRLPDWAIEIAQRLHNEGLIPYLPNQVIVNEYRENQCILKHADSENFADGIATISLLESWDMWFRYKKEKRPKVIKKLERRSVAIMRGESRYHWTHEIPKRKTEHGVKRVRRISLTFRKVAGHD